MKRLKARIEKAERAVAVKSGIRWVVTDDENRIMAIDYVAPPGLVGQTLTRDMLSNACKLYIGFRPDLI